MLYFHCFRQFRVKHVKCSCCQRAIQETDWVRKAKQHVYHLACFACEVCKRQLSTGEEFALIDHKLLCKLHYIEKLESPLTPGTNSVGPMILNSSGNDSDISSHSSTVRESLLPEGMNFKSLLVNFQMITPQEWLSRTFLFAPDVFVISRKSFHLI